VRRPAPALALALVLPLAAAAEPRPLRYDVGRDAAITATLVAAWIASEAAKPLLAPSRCRVCAPGALDAAARDALVWRYGDLARHASDVLAFGVVPAGLAAHQLLASRAAGDADAGWVDLLIVGEAAAVAASLNQAVKYAVGRERPFVHAGNHPEPVRRGDPDDNLSFYSGHTTLAFSLAAAAGTVSTLRGYDGAPWVWTAGLGGAAAVGWFRVAADKHYLTDVLTGAVLGTAVGVAVPRLLHGREPGSAAGSQPLVVPIGIGGTF
jgi:membrane-associated phospholipid phosphatase